MPSPDDVGGPLPWFIMVVVVGLPMAGLIAFIILGICGVLD